MGKITRQIKQREIVMNDLQDALERCRLQGFDVIGFAVKPDEGAMIILNNRHLPKDEFCAMIDMARELYEGNTQNAGNA